MAEVWSIIQAHRERLAESGELALKRQRQRQAWFWTMIEEGLREHFIARSDVRKLLPELEEALAERKITPTHAARQLLALLDKPDAVTPRSKGSRGTPRS
jgi:LAO/AO transport system kinase